MHRLAVLGVLAVSSPARAQTATVVDSLVGRITHAWGRAPASGWRTEWSVVRGDSTLLDAGTAEISGSERSGIYTVTMRPARFAAPTLVGRLRVGYEREEVVAARAIARGTRLETADVSVRRALVWGAPIDSAPPLVSSTLGRAARRVIRAGEAISERDTEGAPVVFAGDSVTAEVIRDGVRLALAGTALQSAPLGARVSIRLARGRRFAGIAIGRNTVRLD